MDNQAIPINNIEIEKVFKNVGKETKKAFDEIDFRDKLVADLEGNEGWKIFKERVNEWIERLKNMIDPLSGESLIKAGDNPYEIGLKYLMISFTISQIMTLISIPEAIQIALDEQQRQEREQSGG